MSSLKSYLASHAKVVDTALDHFLPPATRKPATIHKAMRYSVFAGGKRLRPILCLAAAEACGGKMAAAVPLACAVECIHTYSLIHDDLPSMDNDDYRRGRLTNHKVFGDGMAVLAGDGLLTMAFEILGHAETWPRYDMRALVREVAHAAGSLKLIAGQVADPHDPPDVCFGVQANVRRCPCRTDEAGILIDPQRPRMDAHDARRHADDVDGALGISRIGSVNGHAHVHMVET